MTEIRRPDPCHYDRALGERVTREHRDDCPNPADHRGCKPCTAGHCAMCGRTHATNAEPQTCAKCQGKVDADLVDIRAAYAALATEALEAGHDGQLVAAAPIPGGTAAVLIGPTVRLDLMRTYRGYTTEHFAKDHPSSSKTRKPVDPIPPLAILAQWEDIYRTWLGHSRGHGRATIGRAITYLRDQLPYIAQRSDGPDFVELTRQVRSLRAECERALHDEREPEMGVECFECGDRLVRKFRTRRSCPHSTAARRELQRIMFDRTAALAWLATLSSYGLTPTRQERSAAMLPSRQLVQQARAACDACDQGGLHNPSAGQSWECPGCRKEYDPGEYATAVRRDLLDRGLEGDGWTHVTVAAEAATTLVGMLVPASTVRKWAQRKKSDGAAKVDSKLTESGVRLVFWPDVADEAVAAVRRAAEAVAARRRRVEREAEEARRDAELTERMGA